MHYENKQLYSSARNKILVEHTPCVTSKYKEVPKPPHINPKMFLDELFRDATGHLMLASKKGNIFKGINVGDTQEAYNYALQHCDAEDIYFGVGLLNKIPAPGKRGKAEDIQCLPCVHADIDINGAGHAGKNYPKTEEEAYKILTRFPLKPSLIVKSGGGFHVYLLFSKPRYIRNDQEREAAKKLVSRFQNTIRNFAREQGYTIDNTSDLPRVYRLPGTYNHKNGGKHLVELVNYTEKPPRYTIEEIESHLRPDPPQVTVPAPIARQKNITHQPQQFASSNFDLIIKRCQWMKHCKDNAVTLPEPEWFSMLTIIAQSSEAEKHAHEMSSSYPAYTYEETSKKIEHASLQKTHTCKHIENDLGYNGCSSCIYRNKVKSPIQLGEDDELRQVELALVKGVSEISVDKKALYSEDTLKALVRLKRLDVVKFEKVKADITSCKVRKSDLNSAIKAAEGKYADQHADELPHSFEEGNELYFNKTTSTSVIPEKLCNFTARITQEVLVDDGYDQELKYRFEGKLHTGEKLPSIAWNAGESKKMGFIDSVYGGRAIDYSSNPKKIFTAIKYLSKNITRTTIFTHTGWKKISRIWYYLTAAGAISATGIDKNITVDLREVGLELINIPLAAREEMLAGMIESLKILEIAEDCVSFPMFISTFRPILAEALPVEYSVFIYGYTGSRKSAFTGVILAHYGKDFTSTTMSGNWVSTANVTEKLAALAKDAPYVLDDYIEETNRSKQSELDDFADRILRGQANKSGRARMTSSLGAQKAYVPQGLIIASGEQIPKGKGYANSLRGRMMIIPITPTTIKNQILTGLQQAGNKGLLAASTAAVIRWVAPQIDTLRSELRSRRDNYRDKNGHFKKIHHRTPENYADLLLTLELILECFESYGVISSEQRENLMQRGEKALSLAMKCHGEYVNENPATQYMADIQRALSNGMAHFVNADDKTAPSNHESWGWKINPLNGKLEPAGKMIGYIKGDKAYILPDEGFAVYQDASRALRRNMSGKTALHKQLEKGGFLLGKGEGGYAPKRTVFGGNRVRVLVISKNEIS